MKSNESKINMNMSDREYIININPGILELLGPGLYTNIYYVLAELIANAYDANARNVYILQKENEIVVEDDGMGMSYEHGDIQKYLNVALDTRSEEEDVYVKGSNRKRKRIGRKGIGKLAALSISDRVLVKTIRNKEKSGFILSRNVGDDRKLEPLDEKEIRFENKSIENGTSIVMTNPQYNLHKTPQAIKNNLLKIFPLVNGGFKIHVDTGSASISIDNFDAEIIAGLGALITLGEEFSYLSRNFNPDVPDKVAAMKKLLKNEEAVIFPLKMRNKKGESKKYDLKIKGWIGAYKTTKDRKLDRTDFPDNFISILSNGKLGEYNILSIVGKNKLPEVYVVGQLHVDLFEETELPDMALSNRQGYKSDDPRYAVVINYVSDVLLPAIVKLRGVWVDFNKKEKDQKKKERQIKIEADLREKVESYKTKVSNQAAVKLAKTSGDQENIERVIRNELNALLPIIGLKERVDQQKKRILMSHASSDKSLADVVYKMLVFNNVPREDIIYTSSDYADSRIPEGEDIFDYLRQFFVDSYSSEKLYVVYVTSDEMAKSWFAVTEVGAGWITRSAHKVFNIHNHEPKKPLDTDVEWQTSEVNADTIIMKSKEFDKFVIKIIDVCSVLGYKTRSKRENESELKRYVSIK